jgi:MFS transporter, DHA2 family, multidrug resistance protein
MFERDFTLTFGYCNVIHMAAEEGGRAGPNPSPGGAGPIDWVPRFNPWLIAVSVMLATFMEVLDTAVANVSLPHIAGSLSATPEEATWVLTSYLISNAIVLPMTAWLGSRFGRKRFLMTCIVLFTVASAACGAATSLGMLVAARILQGAGGGALQPIAQAVLMESFPPARRGAAMAAFAMGVIVAPILGPTLGGWITDNYSWRWVFYINLPVGAVALLMAQTFIEDPPYLRVDRSRRVDYLGFGLMVVFLGALQLMLDRGQEVDWFAATWVRWCAVISAAGFVGFIVRELSADAPIVNLRVLANRNFAIGTALITVLGVVLYGTTAMLPLFLQTLLGYPALQSGLAVSPRGLGALTCSIIVGRLIGRVDSRLLIAAGFTLAGSSALLYSRMNLDIAQRDVVWTSLVNGFAGPLIFVPLTTTAMGTLSREQMGQGTGIFNLMRNIGASVGIAAVTTLLTRGTQAHQARLVTHLTPYDPAYQRWLEDAQAHLAPQVGSAAAAPAALGLLYRMLVRQATLLSFLDTFRLLALLALACLPLVFLFRRVRSRPTPVAAR